MTTTTSSTPVLEEQVRRPIPANGNSTLRRSLESRLSERVNTVPPSAIRRFFDIAATMEDVISLGIGEPNFVTPPPMIVAGMESLRQGQTAYTSNAGMIELREAVAGMLERRYNGPAYDPEKEVLITVGVSEAMYLAMQAILDPGTKSSCRSPVSSRTPPT
ncbi:MAG: aminotransferase class I/II-fold pyridoxal phosphate-dependent enzyme [Caldilineaceae bacterium]